MIIFFDSVFIKRSIFLKGIFSSFCKKISLNYSISNKLCSFDLNYSNKYCRNKMEVLLNSTDYPCDLSYINSS